MSKAGDKRPLDAGDNQFLAYTDENLVMVEDSAEENKRVEFAGERAKYLLHAARYPKRDAKLDTIQKFWQRAIQHSADLSQFTVLEEDQKALQFLAKMRAWRDPEQVEAFGYELHFESNPFFTNSVLKKEFKYVAPSDPEALKKDDIGVSQADIDFDFERDVDVITTKIEWKEGKDLTKLHPQMWDPEDPDDLEEPGSMFNFFECTKPVTADIEIAFVEVYEEAEDFFFNRADRSIGAGTIDTDDEDDDDNDSNASEIDLENPKKKAKK